MNLMGSIHRSKLPYYEQPQVMSKSVLVLSKIPPKDNSLYWEGSNIRTVYCQLSLYWREAYVKITSSREAWFRFEFTKKNKDTKGHSSLWNLIIVISVIGRHLKRYHHKLYQSSLMAIEGREIILTKSCYKQVANPLKKFSSFVCFAGLNSYIQAQIPSYKREQSL